MAGNVVVVERRLVAEINRRVKVYQLTSFGESAARDLRLAASRTTPTGGRNDWVPAEPPKATLRSEVTRQEAPRGSE